MKVSLNWLKQYVDINVPVEELCDKMVMAGFEIEEIEDSASSMSNVVVGKIVELTAHPDSDHLQICQIDIGADEPVQIVTGAQNVFEGALVPAALHDSHLPNGMHIKKGKLRGVPSNGMLCSGEELCLTEDDYEGASVYGIMILKENCAPVGTDLNELLGNDDCVIDFKITANRPDCQSVLGIAREIAVQLKTPFKMPDNSYNANSENINDYISVSVENYDLCPRYCGRVIKNVKIEQSPDWMKKCLISAGMRPINNIVDITNFVMLETGLPMHAFDMRDIAKRQIIVRNAKANEKITTLDGKEHELTEDMLVIADGEAPSCLAGIMGSLNSEIKDDTAEIFFECAKFRRDNVRKTARRLGIHTESCARFEKGVDVIATEYAIDRALNLVESLGAGEVVGGKIDCNNGLPKERTVVATVEGIKGLLGVDIPAETMVEILNSLQIKTTLDNGTLICLIPSFRDDIEGKADLAEEVMRIYGYDHIKGSDMIGVVSRGKKLPERTKTDKIKQVMSANSMREIVTYSFISSKAIDALNLADDDKRKNAVKILNPLGDEYSVMRTQLVTSMMTVLATNYNRKNQSARLYETSKIFVPKALPVTEQPDEVPAMSIGMYGDGADFLTLKGIVEAVISIFAKKVDFERAEENYLHPGRSAVAIVNGRIPVATFGEVHPTVSANYGIDTRCYIAEINTAELFKLTQKPILYKQLPKFPAVERDFAILCPIDIPVAKLENAIRQGAGQLCEKIALFDVYTGSQIPEGQKSIAYRLTMRSADSTLNDEIVEKKVETICHNLEKLGATLRG